jgi:hypothetical protein
VSVLAEVSSAPEAGFRRICGKQIVPLLGRICLVEGATQFERATRPEAFLRECVCSTRGKTTAAAGPIILLSLPHKTFGLSQPPSRSQTRSNQAPRLGLISTKIDPSTISRGVTKMLLGGVRGACPGHHSRAERRGPRSSWLQ